MARRRTQPLNQGAPVPRHYEDDQLRDAVRAILAQLDPDHPARVALDDGAPTIEITHLVRTDHEMVSAIMEHWKAWRDRSLVDSMKHQHIYPDALGK